MKVSKEYDYVRKIILKNLRINHEMSGFTVHPDVVEQLKEYFKSQEEK
jgi:hypothetical protein